MLRRQAWFGGLWANRQKSWDCSTLIHITYGRACQGAGGAEETGQLSKSQFLYLASPVKTRWPCHGGLEPGESWKSSVPRKDASWVGQGKGRGTMKEKKIWPQAAPKCALCWSYVIQAVPGMTLMARLFLSTHRSEGAQGDTSTLSRSVWVARGIVSGSNLSQTLRTRAAQVWQTVNWVLSVPANQSE